MSVYLSRDRLRSDESFRVEALRLAQHAVDMLDDDPSDRLYDSRVERAFAAIYHALLDEEFESPLEAKLDAAMEDRVAHNLFLRGTLA